MPENGLLKQLNSTLHEKPSCGTVFLNPFFIIKQNHSIKNVLDARHLTGQSSEYWPLEPLAIQRDRANKNYESAIDIIYACVFTCYIR